MSRSSKMVEVLSSITAFCSIDQEGTISQCVPEQLVVPTDGHGHPLILDIDISNDFRYGMRFAPVQMYEEIQIGEQADEYQPQGHYNYEDEHYTPQHSQLQQQSVEQLDWKQHIDKLLPIAKGILLQSNCSYGNRTDNFTHSKNIEISKKAYCSGVYSECLCRLGNVIGVSSTNNGDVSPDNVVNVVAVSTTHPSIDDLDRKLALSLPVIHSTFVFPEIPNGKHEVQVYSSGDLDMILSLSDSIYDGERVLPLEEKLMDELYDIYKCTLMQDLQCVGFSFKSIKMTETKPENIVESFKTKLDLVSRSEASLRRKSTDQGKGKGNAHDQDRTGVGLVVLDNDWGDAEQTDISEHEVPHYLCNSTKLKREYKTARRKLGRKVDGMGIDELIGIDYISDEISEQPNQEFTNEIFDSQTFLGLLTFSDNPKPDVCDFIEDLSLAGIRFVYFSKTNMNQSKSFGEKLGLETDWNTTILLGRSGTDKRAKVGSRGGYFEDYEIKAQLPKGIQEIREHIKQVDDIPLQARLFAECEESSVAQMVDIFRENGDIVLGFGSVYTHSNAVVFDNCDIRIGVYPKYHSSFTSASVQGCSNLFHSCPSPFMFPSYAHSLPASHFAHLPQYEDSVNLGAVSPSVRISSALNPSILDLSSLLSGIDCSLFLPFDSSLYSILQLAAESRQFICSLQQTLLFALGCVLSLIIVNSIPLFFSLPPLVDSLSTMYLVCFTIPCISFTFLLSAPSSDIMTIMPSKNIFNSKGLISSILYGFLRIFPIVINTLAIYLAVLSLTNDNSSLAKLLFSSPPPPSGAYTLATMFAFVELQISFSFFGLTMMDRLEPIVTYTSFKLFFTERLPFAIRSFSFKRFRRSSSNNVKSSTRSFEHTKTSTAHSNITMPHPTPNAAAAVSFSTGAHLNNNNAATQTSAGTSSSKYFYFFLFVVALTLFSIAFSLVYTTYKHIPPHTISNVNFLVYIFGLVILPLCVLVPVNEYCKFCDKTRFVRSQKIKKLEFNTKLGLHSPL
ncbi:hypothetical protein AX774_g7181 [Zancudomyces culisetae]|uniref:Uncharacterized protein n=1 Tax=Zancudomyces culisetae TaxID=1213189 RepID=A0A1R1PEQ6_ZANCU|nr:hypothetical protein AX774_g7181 [Zancudomyces culisetae]|eukprot:OMH79409.1 hypothetical protein AX774_g7181 [Zancudomyces culisetae]